MALEWIAQTEILQINAMGYKAYNDYTYDKKDHLTGKINPNTGYAMYRVVGDDGKMKRIPIYTASYFKYKETKKERIANSILLSIAWIALLISLIGTLLIGSNLFRMSILIGSVMLNMKWIELMNVLAIPAVIYLGYALICQLTAGEKMRVYNLTVGHIRLLRTALITAILVAIGLALMTYITVNNSLASTADMKTLLFQCAETMSALLIIYSESRRKLDIAENNYEIPDDAEVDYYI